MQNDGDQKNAIQSTFLKLFRVSLDDRELLSGSGVALSISLVGMGAGYLFALLIARNYGAEVMGVFTLSITFLQIFAVLGMLGLDMASVKFVAMYAARNEWSRATGAYRKTLSIAVPNSLLLTVLLFVISPYLAERVFRHDVLGKYLQIISLAVLPRVLLLINSESLRGLKNIIAYSFLQRAAVYIIAVFLLVASMSLLDVDGTVVVAYVLAIYIVSAMSYIWWTRYSKKQMVMETKGKDKKSTPVIDIMKVALPMFFSSSMLLLMQWVDVIMLGVFRSEEEVGIYSIAIKLASLTALSLVSINSIAAPKFAELHSSGETKRLAQVVHKTAKMSFLCSSPILLVLFVFPANVLGLFGDEFTVGVLALLILNVGQLFNVTCGPVGFLLQMTNHQKEFRNIMLLATLVNVILNYLLIPVYGILGSAFANTAGIIIWNITSMIYIYYRLGIKSYYLPFMRWE